ncbi:phytanoyl-CoA dioxygenase family protein [Psychrosphaera haliotis]|uniref:phytanoyl-CoA dioxygenase family protein n=1 Tax=Psychrosphaera haliotis TaxID=555083 RepID=UPI0023725D05|nr:phytanoyl-CoA dioxygenase family protein [Psychrosphaera haliotis]
MNKKYSQCRDEYSEVGYFVLRDFFTQTEIASLKTVILEFHEHWKVDNQTFYNEEAFNSSLITGSQYLDDAGRLSLFNFISSSKLLEVVHTVIKQNPAFMNTQLFFNPVRPEQKDFWHRDCQYDHDLEGQKKAIQETQVVHFRIPLFDELGMELVPGSHVRWDNEQELNVREELNGYQSYDDLPLGKKIPLAAGDLLVFSADMIHRGIYGLDRLALDVLVFDSSADFIDYVDDDCLPEPKLLEQISNPALFKNTLRLKSL